MRKGHLWNPYPPPTAPGGVQCPAVKGRLTYSLHMHMCIGGTLADAAEAAGIGAKSTESMEGLAGRSNYVPVANMRGTPDPGAAAVAEVFLALAEAFR